MTYYPVFLDLSGRRCVVLGDSPTADEKAAGLRAAGADVVHLRRAFAGGDLVGAYLAVEASGEMRSQAGARAEADAERVLLNVADVTHHCDWIAPAVVRRGPLQVAISTSGESPFLASTLRARLESTIGEEWGPLTELLGRVRRRLRRHGVPMERQVRAYRRVARPDTLALLGTDPDAAAAVAAAIEADALDPVEDGVHGLVVLVGAGPGDPGLLTVAGREALMSADVVVHDSLVSAAVLQLCRPGCRVVDAGKRGGRPSATQAEITATLIDGGPCRRPRGPAQGRRSLCLRAWWRGGCRAPGGGGACHGHPRGELGAGGGGRRGHPGDPPRRGVLCRHRHRP